jgi:hypothetical protein
MQWTFISRCIGLALTLTLVGCMHLSMPSVPGNPLVVNLPFRLAGIRDERPKFAQVFAAELTTSGDGKEVAKWLHTAIEQATPTAGSASSTHGVSVLVVPGIFGDCVDGQALPFSDGQVRDRPRNYTEGYAQLAAQLQTYVRAIEVRGRASSESNAAIIARELEAEALKSEVKAIVLVGYSKGVPDTLVALRNLDSQQRLPAKVRALVAVSGVVMGTPIADRMEWLYEGLTAKLSPLDCTVSTGGEVTSLTVRERTTWLVRNSLPQNVRMYSVVAHVHRTAVAPALVAFYDALATLDRLNDGQVFASSMLLPNATLLAEVKSDHWTYVLALNRSPNLLVRSMVSPTDFPRDAFFRAIVKTVAVDLAR